MARRAAACLALALLLAGPPVASAQAERIVPRLAELRAGYGAEGWKDEPPLAPLAGVLPLPAAEGPLGVYENPYLGGPRQGPQPWLGYNLTAIVELAGAPAGGAAHRVAASLHGADGGIPAKLARLGGGRFAATFDLDGEAGTDRPEALPGPARLEVVVYEEAAAPGAADRRVAEAAFAVEVRPARLDLGGLLLADAALGYADLGPGDRTLVQPRLVHPDEAVTIVADLGAPGAPAALAAWHGREGAVLAEGRTDAAGLFTATVPAAQLVGGDAPGLAIVAAHLTGEGARLASAVVAVPVSAHPTRIVRFDYAGAPGPLAGPLDTLAVGVEDLSAPGPGPGAPARGTLYALDLAGEAGASAPFPPTAFAPGAAEREARLPAQALPRQEASYRLVAVLLTGDGRLYSLAQAVRGFDGRAADATGAAFVPGEVEVVVRNFNDNLDGAVDAGLAFPLRVRVEGLPNGTVEREVAVDEGGEARLRFPYVADAGWFGLDVTVTGGEFRREASAALSVLAPSHALPGFDPALLLAALGALAVHRRRARA